MKMREMINLIFNASCRLNTEGFLLSFITEINPDKVVD